MSVINRKEIAFCSYIDFQISPCIFLHSKSFFPVFCKRDKSTALFFQCKKNLLFLLAAYQKFLKGMLIQFPFTHVIIKCLDPRVFILKNLKKVSGPEQLHCLSRITICKLLKVFQTLDFSIPGHNERLLDNCSKRNIIFTAIAYNRKLSVFNMSRHKSSSVICIIDIYRIPIKALLCTLYTIRRRIDKSAYCPFSFILQRKASLIFLSFSDTHRNVSLRENNFRLRDVKIPLCKTFDLILQIRHLLKFLIIHKSVLATTKNATINYIISLYVLAMGD